MSMEQSVAVDKFVGRIRQKYVERRLNREKQWPPCKSEKLVKLELVEGEQRQGYSAGQTRGRDDETIKRSPLAYSDILKAKQLDKRRIVRKVLVEGDAGIGKTTLCTALSEDWANGKLFQEFEILLLLHLRQNRIASAASLLDLLKLLHPSQKVCELVADYIDEEDEKVLILADGWDELSTEDRGEGSFLYELLFGECYSLSVIVTSRPSASASLRDLPCIDRLAEVRGFSEDNIKEFIQCELAGDKAKRDGLLEQLEGNPLIESVCSVPLNCAIICHLCHYFDGALPTTMTELYTKLILNVALRNINKIPKHKSISSLSHFDSLPEDLKKPWSLLCEVAFHALSEDKIVFSRENLSTRFQNLASLLCFGLLQSAESILVDGHGVSFHFLHLTFQEYLAALYLVRQPTDKQLLHCRLYVRSGRFEMVWRFFFGLSFSLCSKPVDLRVPELLVDANHFDTRTLCHFALEANQTTINHLIASNIIASCFLIFLSHIAFDSAAIIHVIANLHGCNCTIDLRNCGLRDQQITALADALAGEHRNLSVLDINLSGNRLTDECLAYLFERASPAFSQSLSHVYLSNNMIGPKAINSLTSMLAKSCSTGAYYAVDISDNPLGVDGLIALSNAIHANKLAHLEALSLAGSLTSDADANANLMLALGHCVSLGTLDLSRNNLGVPGGKALGKVLSDRPTLKYLALTETMLGDKGVSALLQNLVSCKLKGLTLDNNGFQAAGISCLAESVCAGCVCIPCSSYNILKVFSVANNPLGLEGVTAVVKILTSDHFGPDSICLSGCQLTIAGGSASNPDFVNAVDIQRSVCSQQLQATHSFEKLYVDNNDFSGEGIHVLAAFMYACPCVEDLYCYNCGITSSDLKQLLVLVSELRLSLPWLSSWDFSNNDIGDDGVSVLIQHLSVLPTLKNVTLDGNIRVSPGMLKTLKEKLDPQRESYLWTEVFDDSLSDSESTLSEDYGEESSPHTDHEDSDTLEQCRSVEAGIAAVTPEETTLRLSDSGSFCLPREGATYMDMEDEGLEQLQPTALDSEETITTGAEGQISSESRDKQEVVHPSTSSAITTQVQRLDRVLDSEHDGVSKHLGQIADTMDKWEGPIAEQLDLTKVDIAAIWTKHPRELNLQTRAALEKWKQRLGSNATYNRLVKVFENAGRKDLADLVREIADT